MADYATYSSLEAPIPRCRTVLDDEQSRFPCWEACPFLKRPQLPQMATNTLHFLPERASPRAQRGRIVLQVGGNLRVARRRRRQDGEEAAFGGGRAPRPAHPAHARPGNAEGGRREPACRTPPKAAGGASGHGAPTAPSYHPPQLVRKLCAQINS